MNMRYAAALLLAGVTSAPFAADTTSQQNLTLEGAKRAVAASIAYAREHGAPGGAIAVVDAGGHVVYLERLDGTFAAGADISVGKARTAVMFKRPTRGIEETINKGRAAMIPVGEVTWFTPLQGGIPITVGGQVVGGIGVSGAASAQQDEEIAIAGAQALASSAPAAQVRHFDSNAVARAFHEGETGGTLVNDRQYRVNASRRDGPGQAEIHTTDTDVFYILEGAATVITGGTLVEPSQVASGELRGSAIRGGTEKRIAKGDVLTIPHGVPHWFKSVDAPFRYYVIKSVTGS
ncbi:MAG: heme-binding protein [Steroidobacteraceae bacterium]